MTIIKYIQGMIYTKYTSINFLLISLEDFFWLNVDLLFLDITRSQNGTGYENPFWTEVPPAMNSKTMSSTKW